MISSMFSAQLTTLWYRSTNCLAGFSPKIPINTTQYFRLITFLDILTHLLIRSSCTFTVSRLFFHLVILQTVGHLGREISSSQDLNLNTGQHKQNKHIHIPNIHALCGIRTHDPGFRAIEDSTCPRPLGYRDRLGYSVFGIFLLNLLFIPSRLWKLWRKLFSIQARLNRTPSSCKVSYLTSLSLIGILFSLSVVIITLPS
jgi:hypothetical protein